MSLLPPNLQTHPQKHAHMKTPGYMFRVCVYNMASGAAVPTLDGCQDESFGVGASKCAWVIPVLLDSQATAAATLAFRSFPWIRHIFFAPDLFILAFESSAL